jgi:hypothetical protein
MNLGEVFNRSFTSGQGQLTDFGMEMTTYLNYGANRRVTTPVFAELRTPVIPPGYQPIPGYEAHHRRQEARARMGTIAERRGKRTPSPIVVTVYDPRPVLSRQQRW